MTLPSVSEEAARVVAGLEDTGLPARLLGGLGVAAHDHVEVPPSLLREFADIDLVVPRRTTRPTIEKLTAMGYTPNQRFNALHGAKRLLFYDAGNERQLDVFVGEFAMCHRLDLQDRLDRHPRALSAADLLLTKLQIVELNRKDLLDAVRLLLNHELTHAAEEAQSAASIDLLCIPRITSVTRADWGWHTTLSDNLAKVAAGVPQLLPSAEVELVSARLETLLAAMAAATKTTRWKGRAIIGRRTAWYELPDEVTAQGGTTMTGPGGTKRG